MRYGSICSGVAPQTKSWREMGLDCAWFSEIEPFPSAVLNHHYPEVPNLGDFTRIEQSGPIDLLVGGTPCQSFSVAGKRAGLDDPRGNLTIEFARLAQRLRPRWLAWENVPGVLSIDGGRTFGTFLGMLGQLGYGFAYRILDAQYFGVAQRRRRVFVVGCLGDWRAAAAVLFERESLSGNPAPSREKREDAAGTVGARTCRSVGAQDASNGHIVPIGLDEEQNAIVDGFGCLKSRERGGGFEGVVAHGWPVDVAPTLNAHFGDKQGLEDQHALNGAGLFVPVAFSAKDHGADAPVLMRNREGREGGGKGPLLSPDQSLTLAANANDQVLFAPIGFHSRQDPINLTECSLPIEAKGGQAVAFAENQRHELRLSDVSPQLSCAGGKPGSGYPATLQGMAVRRLTPRECGLLQGFPDEGKYCLIPTEKWRKITRDEGQYLIGLGLGKWVESRGCWRTCIVADGPVYKATGNSWAVPVLNWIGRRIKLQDELLSKNS